MNNYADNNTVLNAHKQPTVLTAEVESETTLNWFDDNSGKLQAIVGGKNLIWTQEFQCRW